MEGRLVLKNCSLVGPGGCFEAGRAVVAVRDRVMRVGADEANPVLPGDWEVACRGRLVTRGKVNGSSHLVARALGVPPGAGRLWAESLLQPNEIEVLSAFAMAEAVRLGTVLMVDQVRCSQDVRGALLAEARSARKVGARLVLAHRTDCSAENPSAQRELAENAAFVQELKPGDGVRPALGLEAAGEASGEHLAAAGRLWHQGPAPLLCALGPEAASSSGGEGFLTGLSRLGLLGESTLLALGRRLDSSELQLLLPSGALVAGMAGPLDERSQADDFERLSREGRVVPGGEWPALWAGTFFKAATDRVRRAGQGAPEQLLWALWRVGPSTLRARFFDDGSEGVEAGSLADLVVHDWVPAAGCAAFSLEAWLAIEQAPVAWSIVGGRVAVREGQLLGCDFLELSREATAVRSAVRARAGLGPG